MRRHRQTRRRVAALVAGGMALGVAVAAAQQPRPPADATSVPRVTQEQFRTLLADGKAYVVDVRTAVSYSAGRIPGAVSVPFDEVLGRADEVLSLAGDRTIVTYCSCPSEHTSAEAGLVLIARGGRDVRALVGGYIDWVRAGGQIER